jgi:hypothetical protein
LEVEFSGEAGRADCAILLISQRGAEHNKSNFVVFRRIESVGAVPEVEKNFPRGSFRVLV